MTKAKAKVNLFLEILSHRKVRNGFHSIKTVISEIDLSDNISFRLFDSAFGGTEKETIKISCSSNAKTIRQRKEEKIEKRENIVYKVANYLKDKYQVDGGMEIILKKNIPICAGLAGGSSDAALTIKMCNSLWNLKLSKKEMHKIAAKFGSDINFFLDGGLGLLSGRGEKVQQISSNLKIENLLLVNPLGSWRISSKDAYSWAEIENEKKFQLKNILDAIRENDVQKVCKNMYNGLEKGVFARYPAIKKIKDKMFEFGALGSLMSGSGATVFGIFDSKKSMKVAENYFQNLDYWVCKSKI
ncbi:MAG: 4-(cytidine 5'-diphospho)-2-C-methyl-D-erythritol kinase [Candidatus Cloacimonetes bacterium]|nr:4-(cytidine 5'-diphospho)-2-C-methyl-D-erythritol kinase [Candidatus Cloacimonadota bacterium]